MSVLVHPFFHVDTHSFTYVVVEPHSRRAAIIDPVLDYDASIGMASTASADGLLEFVSANDLIVRCILETRVHADHLTAARYLKRHLLCAQTAISTKVLLVQEQIARRYELNIAADGSQFDRLLEDGDHVCLGPACGRVLLTPGHTPACATFIFDDKAFVGDTLFMRDIGSARCDFPGGCSRLLRKSIDRIFSLPERTKLFTCHEYGSNGRDIRYLTTVEEERATNVHFAQSSPVERFVRTWPSPEDALSAPALVVPAVTANVQGGMDPSVDASHAAAVKRPA